MSKAKIIEIVLFKTNEGVNPEEFKVEMTKYNDFLKSCDGFLSRKIGVSIDGQYLDIMHFADLNSCNACAEKFMHDADLMAFQVGVMDKKINQNSVYSQRFEVFNDISVEASKATVADICLMRPKKGVKTETFETEMIKFNENLAEYKGLIARKNGVSADGQYFELAYWTGLDAFELANETVVQVEGAEIESFFDMTDEEAEITNQFEIFSSIN